MKRHWIEYRESRSEEPLTYWVHTRMAGPTRHAPPSFDPPLPKPVPGEGFAVFFVEIDGFTFRFASLHEIKECINILSQKVFPSSLRTSGRPKRLHVANNHWLNRLPTETKSWKYRQKAVKYLSKAIEEFQEEVAERS